MCSNNVIDLISEKFGDNTILKASSLMEYSTIRKRNNKKCKKASRRKRL